MVIKKAMADDQQAQGSLGEGPFATITTNWNPDKGTFSREETYPTIAASPDAINSISPAFSRDVVLNSEKGTSLRLFIPPSPLPRDVKLPVYLYFHGGGFILFSVATPPFHTSCAVLAVEIPAIVVSVDYRLAPEHRLPAAYGDAVEAVEWVCRQFTADQGVVDPWIRTYGDSSRCFLSGSSAGGNIAYHTALRLRQMTRTDMLENINVVGLVLNRPLFGGEERTETEERMKDDMILPLVVNDLMWELALPNGMGRQHEWCNPMAARPQHLPIKCLVRAYKGDPLCDRIQVFARMLEKEVEGVELVLKLEEGGCHGVEIIDKERFEVYVKQVKEFVWSV